MPDPIASTPRSRFSWAVFHGRCRRRLLAGLVLLALAAAYAAYGARQFGRRGADGSAFDRAVVVRLAHAMTPPPVHLRGIEPSNSRELYLLTVIADQQDVLTGLTVLLLRLIPAVTLGVLGMVLVTGGSTEWEVRSEIAAGYTAPKA